MQEFGRNIWDQSLTYGHYNLHNASLLQKAIGKHATFADFCLSINIVVLAAAPLSMGLLTRKGPPGWHPAPSELKEACELAAVICDEHNTDISTLALLMALSNPRIPCTILGMGLMEEVKTIHALALRFQGVSPTASQEEVLRQILTDVEWNALEALQDPVNGPFASVWTSGMHQWDGVQEVRKFWEQLPDKEVSEWHIVEK